MKSFSFFVNKPGSVSIRTEAVLQDHELSVTYYVLDSLFYKRKMTNFSTYRHNIQSCKRKRKIFLSIVDLVFYAVIIILIVAGKLWENNIGLDIFSAKSYIGFGIIVILFTLLKVTTILDIRLKDGKSFYIPTGGYIISTKKQKKLMDELCALLN